MAEITAIPQMTWVSTLVWKRYLIPMYGKRPLRLNYLPLVDVLPEHFCRYRGFDVETMVACLQAGAWISEDWRPYVRRVIGQRLEARERIFKAPFDEIREPLANYQRDGGTFKQQAELRSFASSAAKADKWSPLVQATSRLILSITDDVQINTLIQPFHWIRVALGCTDRSPIYAMTWVQSEAHKQKVALCQMLRAPAPKEP